MQRFLIMVLMVVVLAPAALAQDDMQKKVTALGSTLGAAVGKERRGSGGGRVREFEKGAIYWSRKTGARFVSAAALAEYKKLGGESGKLGYPVSDEIAADGTLSQTFEHGFLRTTATGEVQPTLLPGVVLTENTLTVLNPTPVSLELELDPIGFLVFRQKGGKVETTIKCSCVKNAEPFSQRLGFCTVEFSDDKKIAMCKDSDCDNGSCTFSAGSDK